MKLFTLSLLMFLCPLFSMAQESKPVNRQGLLVEYGMGSSAVVDRYISSERYTGTLPYIGFWYGRMNGKKGFQVGLTNQVGDDFENHAIRAEFSRVSLNFDQYFRLKEFRIFSKPASWYLGPSVEYFESEIISRFTSNHKGFSELIMASMGINTLLEWDFTSNFTASAFLRSNIIGVNYKTHDETHYPNRESTLQTLFVANNLNADLYLRYRLLKRLSLGIKAKGQYTRTTGWDDASSFTNSLLVFTIIHF